MKFISTVFLLLAITASVSGRGKKEDKKMTALDDPVDEKKEIESGSAKGNKSDKKSKDKSSADEEDSVEQQPSFLSTFLGNFETVIEILKTGDASALTQGACDSLTGSLGILDSMSCTCQGTLVNGFREIRGDAECAAISETCLTETDEFCGAVLLDGSLVGGLGTPLSGNVSACLAATIPQGLGDYSLCVSAESSPETPEVGFDSCSAVLNNMPCACTPCEGADFAVKFNCSNVDVSPFPGIPIYGPTIDTCKRLSFQDM